MSQFVKTWWNSENLFCASSIQQAYEKVLVTFAIPIAISVVVHLSMLVYQTTLSEDQLQRTQTWIKIIPPYVFLVSFGIMWIFMIHIPFRQLCQ